MQNQPPAFLDGPRGALAYRRRDGESPGLFWLGGFRSDMKGTKASFLDEWATGRGRGFLRFDYSGHGESDGDFEHGSIGDWTEDALAVFDALTQGPQILIGSSMGAWTATLLALARPARIAAALFIAPAPDFTERLIWPSLSSQQREEIRREGRLMLPSDNSDAPEIITWRLIEDGRRHLVMTGSIALTAPVRILHGMKDDSVPWRHAMAFGEQIESDDVEITLMPRGDHRLSSPADLKRLTDRIDGLLNLSGRK